MTPAFKIIADSADITALIADRLISLEVTDEEGIKSDRLELEIDNRDYRVAMPEHGAKLEVSLGFRGTGLSYIGGFIVDSTGGSGPVLKLRIGAKAADMAGEIRAPKTRAWEGVTLKDIVARIAGEAGLKPVVGDSIASIKFPFVAQTAESDLHLLTRLALPLDATAKPADGRLVVLKRGEGKSAAGDDLEPVVISPRQLVEWDFEVADRGQYKTIEAEWSELKAGKTHVVTAGSGAPKKKLRRVFSSASEAQAAADAALTKAERGASTLDASLSTFAPGLFAGSLIEPQGLGPDLTGQWHVKTVTHALDGSGLLTRFTAEKAAK